MEMDAGLVIYRPPNGTPYGMRCVLTNSAMHLGSPRWKYFRLAHSDISNVEMGGLFRKAITITCGRQEHTIGVSRDQAKNILRWING